MALVCLLAVSSLQPWCHSMSRVFQHSRASLSGFILDHEKATSDPRKSAAVAFIPVLTSESRTASQLNKSIGKPL